MRTYIAMGWENLETHHPVRFIAYLNIDGDINDALKLCERNYPDVFKGKCSVREIDTEISGMYKL